MRASIYASLGLAIGSAFLGGAPVKAQDPGYPYCLEESTRGGQMRNCGFVSFQQCLESRSTPGGGNCYRNPAFPSPYAYEPRPRLRRDYVR